MLDVALVRRVPPARPPARPAIPARPALQGRPHRAYLGPPGAAISAGRAGESSPPPRGRSRTRRAHPLLPDLFPPTPRSLAGCSRRHRCPPLAPAALTPAPAPHHQHPPSVRARAPPPAPAIRQATSHPRPRPRRPVRSPLARAGSAKGGGVWRPH